MERAVQFDFSGEWMSPAFVQANQNVESMTIVFPIQRDKAIPEDLMVDNTIQMLLQLPRLYALELIIDEEDDKGDEDERSVAKEWGDIIPQMIGGLALLPNLRELLLQNSHLNQRSSNEQLRLCLPFLDKLEKLQFDNWNLPKNGLDLFALPNRSHHEPFLPALQHLHVQISSNNSNSKSKQVVWTPDLNPIFWRTQETSSFLPNNAKDVRELAQHAKDAWESSSKMYSLYQALHKNLNTLLNVDPRRCENAITVLDQIRKQAGEAEWLMDNGINNLNNANMAKLHTLYVEFNLRQGIPTVYADWKNHDDTETRDVYDSNEFARALSSPWCSLENLTCSATNPLSFGPKMLAALKTNVSLVCLTLDCIQLRHLVFPTNLRVLNLVLETFEPFAQAIKPLIWLEQLHIQCPFNDLSHAQFNRNFEQVLQQHHPFLQDLEMGQLNYDHTQWKHITTGSITLRPFSVHLSFEWDEHDPSYDQAMHDLFAMNKETCSIILDTHLTNDGMPCCCVLCQKNKVSYRVLFFCS